MPQFQLYRVKAQVRLSVLDASIEPGRGGRHVLQVGDTRERLQVGRLQADFKVRCCGIARPAGRPLQLQRAVQRLQAGIQRQATGYPLHMRRAAERAIFDAAHS